MSGDGKVFKGYFNCKRCSQKPGGKKKVVKKMKNKKYRLMAQGLYANIHAKESVEVKCVEDSRCTYSNNFRRAKQTARLNYD